MSRVEQGDTIEYLGAAYDDAGKPLRGRTGVVEEFYGKSGPSGRRFMMRVRFGSRVYDMSQEAPLRIVKHARRHHRSRYPSGQHKPRFRVGQTVKFRARTHHGEPVSYGRVLAVSGLREYGEQPLYFVKLPNGVRVHAHQDSLAAMPRSKASRERDPTRKLAGRDAESLRRYLAHLQSEHPEYTYGVDHGRVYSRIWKRLGNQSTRSVVAFVDADGAIYRADSWKARGRRLGHVTDVGRDPGRKLSPQKRAALARKIRKLRHEGYPQAQAVAIAHRMLGVARRRGVDKTRGRKRARR